jgi:hypothetical protein
MIDFIPLKLANPDHAPADNRNGGTSTMTKKDWINGRLGISNPVSDCCARARALDENRVKRGTVRIPIP